MSTQKRQVLVRVQPTTYEKFKIISDKNHRAVSNQVEWLMLQFIAEYEQKNGQISLGESGVKSLGVINNNLGGTNLIAIGGDNNYRSASN